jgi:hypothetical protein
VLDEIKEDALKLSQRSLAQRLIHRDDDKTEIINLQRKLDIAIDMFAASTFFFSWVIISLNIVQVASHILEQQTSKRFWTARGRLLIINVSVWLSVIIQTLTLCPRCPNPRVSSSCVFSMEKDRMFTGHPRRYPDGDRSVDRNNGKPSTLAPRSCGDGQIDSSPSCLAYLEPRRQTRRLFLFQARPCAQEHD